MTPEEALDFIHSVKWRGSRPGLSRTRELVEKLGSPQKRCRFIHVAGTNGKGSISAMLASILTKAGYKTGLYTSPYISRFNERISVDGQPISDGELCRLTELIKPVAEGMTDSPTEFEIVTALGMKHFANRECDFVVLEVGMGGRLDSTNVIDAPELAVISRIGLDHTAELGSTVEEIAVEKAGIIKPGCCVISYEQEQSVMDVLLAACLSAGADFRAAEFDAIGGVVSSREGQSFRYKNGETLTIPLLGRNQLRNAAVVLECVDALRRRGVDISRAAVAEGLACVSWLARFEIVSKKPWFVVDGGHNPQCMETVRDNLLELFPDMRRIMLVGVLADKDYESMFSPILPYADAFVTVTPDNPRALSAQDLAKFFTDRGKPASPCETIAQGVEKAISLADADSVICAAGSLYMAGAVRACFDLT